MEVKTEPLVVWQIIFLFLILAQLCHYFILLPSSSFISY